MSGREKKLLIAFGLIVAVSLPFLPIWGGDEGNGNERGERRREVISAIDNRSSPDRRASSGGDTATEFPRLRTDQLDRLPEKFEGALRNLFTFSSRTDNNTDLAEVVDQDLPHDGGELEAATDARPEIGRPAPQRLTDYDYLGFVERDGKRFAAFLWRGRYFVARAGETVNKTFEIKSIERQFVHIYVVGGDFEQRLKLRAPVGNEG